jgi:hypothetical protein
VSKEATMAKFLNNLNFEISNIMELQYFVELKDMMHMDTKVEQ